jgi:hypothetical protein
MGHERVAIDQRHVQTSGMAGEKQGLVDVRKAHHHNAAVASATDDHHA